MNINTSTIIELIVLFAIFQIFPFLIYGLDKLLAKLGISRIPEKVLLEITFIFGIIGSIAGMRFFRHKIRKSSFQHNFTVVAILRIIMLFFSGLIVMTFPDNPVVESFMQTLHWLFSYIWR